MALNAVHAGTNELAFPENHFTSGATEISLSTAVLFSPFVATANRPQLDFTESAIQYGWMLGDVKHHGLWRGNYELVGEALGGAIFRGSGNYLGGGTVWLRRNFVPKNWRLTPYIQGGLGITITDADRVLVGQNFNFNLDVGVGARYFVTRNCSLNLEYRYQHISNAKLARHDLGINAHGPMLGISFFF
jgi:hypothetical protein